MAGKKETPEQIRERVEKHCAANLATSGGLSMVFEGTVVPAATVVRDGKEQIVPVSTLTPEEAKELGFASDDAAEADDAAEGKADKPASRKR